MLSDLFRRIRITGFVGPYYAGVGGRLRFVVESLVLRDELVMAATAESVAAVGAPPDIGLQAERASAFAQLEKYREELDRAYYAGYIDRWRAPFSWGEEVAVGTLEGRIACYAWIQVGHPDGYPTYYGRLLSGDARVLRVGVLPAFRRRGLNRALVHRVLTDLLGRGYQRIFVECYLHNVPSTRGLMAAGFQPIGLITVLEAWPLRGFVRWRTESALRAALRRVGLPMD